jgi:alkylhydroperoxidase/carboxymuconolactone decarboxylase family protein YurZ
MDAYKSMYDRKDEVINEHHKKDADGNTIPHEDEELNEGKIPAGLQAYLDKKKGKKEDKKEVKEETDMFDTILEHYLNEGYQREDIIKAMSSLNEEPITLATIGALLAKGGAMAAKGAAVAAKGAMGAAKAGGAAVKGAMKGVVSAAKPVTKSIGKVVTKVKKDPMGAIDKVNKVSDTISKAKNVITPTDQNLQKKPAAGQVSTGSYQSSSVDLFDIVKGQLLDEGLSEEEIKDIMLTLTPDEILKEIEESSMSAGEGADRHMGTDDVARSKEQIGSMFNKNIPAKRNNKVDKVTRKAINTSARDLGIQGPTTLNQSVEPKGETI